MGDIPKPTGLDWVQLEKDMNSIASTETAWNRIKRKCKENPFVPLGTMLTVGALSYGVYSFWNGKPMMQQYMMRLRVLAQMFTVVVAVTGIVLSLPKEKRNFRDFIKSGEPEARRPT